MDEKKRLERLLNKPLTRRQQKFVNELVCGDGLLTARESAIRAGFSPSSAHSRAYEMMSPAHCPHVLREIERLRDELDEKYAVNYKRSERDLKLIRDASLEAGAYNNAVQSEVARGKLAGLYTTKTEIRRGSIDALSRSEVESELEKIRRSLGEIIDITPTEEEAETEEYRSGVLAIDQDGSENDQSDDSDDPH